MKKIILISALLFSFNVFADNDADTIEEGGVLFKEYPNKFFNGPLILFHSNGTIKEKLAYKDGLKEGSRMTFHENGNLFEQETYLKGKLEGVFKGYYDNEELWWEGFAMNNLRHGEIKVFYETGKLKYMGEYKFNLKEGLWEYFNEEEVINNQECYLNGEIVELSNCGI